MGIKPINDTCLIKIFLYKNNYFVINFISNLYYWGYIWGYAVKYVIDKRNDYKLLSYLCYPPHPPRPDLKIDETY